MGSKWYSSFINRRSYILILFDLNKINIYIYIFLTSFLIYEKNYIHLFGNIEVHFLDKLYRIWKPAPLLTECWFLIKNSRLTDNIIAAEGAINTIHQELSLNSLSPKMPLTPFCSHLAIRGQTACSQDTMCKKTLYNNQRNARPIQRRNKNSF